MNIPGKWDEGFLTATLAYVSSFDIVRLVYLAPWSEDCFQVLILDTDFFNRTFDDSRRTVFSLVDHTVLRRREPQFTGYPMYLSK